MPFPTSPTAQDALTQGQMTARRLKDRLIHDRGMLAGQNVKRSFVRGTLDAMLHARAVMVSLAGTPGLQQFAKDQYANQGLDIAAEWLAVRQALDNATATILQNYPKSGNGAVEEMEFNAQGVTVEREFTPAQMAGTVIPILDAVIATIN